MILGITGGSGCGKTTLLALIAAQGGTVLDCDRIYHELLSSNPALPARIAQRFPGTVQNGVVDRKKLGTLVFSDPAALADLNRITHDAVKAEVVRRLTPRPALAAIDAIALFEGGLAPLCDVTVAVEAPEPARVTRLMARDGISQSYAQSRIHAQKPPEYYQEKCDYILSNDTTPEEFTAKCLAFFRELAILEKE